MQRSDCASRILLAQATGNCSNSFRSNRTAPVVARISVAPFEVTILAVILSAKSALPRIVISLLQRPSIVGEFNTTTSLNSTLTGRAPFRSPCNCTVTSCRSIRGAAGPNMGSGNNAFNDSSPSSSSQACALTPCRTTLSVRIGFCLFFNRSVSNDPIAVNRSIRIISLRPVLNPLGLSSMTKPSRIKPVSGSKTPRRIETRWPA